MTEQDREEFILYLRACTDAQLQGVLEKERKAARHECVSLVKDEIQKRESK